MDVFFPPIVLGTNHKPSILVFFHGGGFVRGSRGSLSDLVYKNLGAFFASRGVLTIVPDYRLVPDAHFPDGAEDICDALLWVVNHISEGDASRIFCLAHSAGGVHVLSMLMSPTSLLKKPVPTMRGVFLLGVPCDFTNNRSPSSRAAAESYYEGSKKLAKHHPIGLLTGINTDHVLSLPPIKNMLAESEPRALKKGIQNFWELYRQKGGVIEDVLLDGHDHPSPVLALGSGIGEEWAEDIVQYIRSTET